MPADPPTAEAIRHMADTVLQRDEYQLDSGAEMSSLADSLIVRALRWLLSLFVDLADSLAFLPGFLRYPAAALLVCVVAWLIYRIVRGLSRRVQVTGPESELRDRIKRTADPEEFEQLAAAARQKGRFVEAIRWLLRAALLRLERTEKRKPRPGTTNRELLRRYRSTPVVNPLRTLVDSVDLHWYGDRPADEAEFERCRTSYQELNVALGEGTTAVEAQTAVTR
jgi:hypothetical protein